MGLFEGLFGSTIKPGVWREADILRTYGRPDRDPRSCTYQQLEEPVNFDLAEILSPG